VLAAACNPDSLLPPSAGLAGADEVITTSGSDDVDNTFPEHDDRTSAQDEDFDDWDDEDDYEDERGRS
jgi:hypothetical protein